MSFVIGLDIGGTSTRIAAVTAGGAVLARTSIPTGASRGPGASIGAMIDEVRAMVAALSPPLHGIGVGITGPVDPFTGIVDNPHTLAGWPPTDLKAPFEAAFGVPVVVDNDANVAAMGESWIGVAAGRHRVAMVTIGTGLGVAVIADGIIQRAADGRHGEAGHMVLNSNGPPCYCGAHGCWEVLASGTALGVLARERVWHPDGALWRLAGGDIGRADASLLFEAATAGDPRARQVVEETAGWIGLGLVNLASTFMPDVFVLSGSVATHLETMRSIIEGTLRRHAVVIPTYAPVLAARLGDDAGALGAGKLALDLLRTAPPVYGGQIAPSV